MGNPNEDARRNHNIAEGRIASRQAQEEKSAQSGGMVFVTIEPGGHENDMHVFGSEQSFRDYMTSQISRPLTDEQFQEFLESGMLDDYDIAYYQLPVE